MSTQAIHDLLQSAVDDGAITQATLNGLNIADLGATIQNSLGIPPIQYTASSTVTLVTLLIDDSSSIASARNTDNVINGVNSILDALTASKQGDTLQIHIELLNKGSMGGFKLLKDTDKLSRATYQPNGCTPLYDQMQKMCLLMLAKAQWYMDAGIDCRSVLYVVTDGEDVGSREATPAKVNAIVTSMLQQEIHVVGAVGIADGHTDFRRVFASMGIPDGWILTPANDPSEIRKAFQMISQSATKVSQTAGGSLSTVAAGGFGI